MDGKVLQALQGGELQLLKTCSRSHFTVEESFMELCDTSRAPLQGCAYSNQTAMSVNYQLLVDSGCIALDG